MAADRYAPLVEARAGGRAREHRVRHNRHVVFEDGTVWFPEGYEAPGAQVHLGILLVVAVGSLIGSIGAVVDGSMKWGWYFGPALVVSGGLLAWALRRARAKTAAKEQALACGVFLFDDAIVIRDAGYDREAPRDAFVATRVRAAFSGNGSQSIPYLTLVAADGGEDLHTQLHEASRKLVDDWLAGDYGSRRTDGPPSGSTSARPRAI